MLISYNKKPDGRVWFSLKLSDFSDVLKGDWSEEKFCREFGLEGLLEQKTGVIQVEVKLNLTVDAIRNL